VHSAADQIRAAIAESDGAIPFEQFMHLALYGDGGFYRSGGIAGRRGDFITSPEVGPLFGAVLARMFDSVWRRLGEPDPFTVVEGGAGPGTLARAVRAARPDCLASLRYLAVEVSDAQRAMHPEWVTSVSAMPTETFNGVILANELLDNLAFRLFVMDSGWREAYVVARPDGTFAEVLRTAADVDELPLPNVRVHGARVPVQTQAAAWVANAQQLLERGTLIVVDYAAPTTEQLALRPWREWLRTYRNQARGDHYLINPGLQDITAEVAIDQMIRLRPTNSIVRTQRQFLQRWGIDQLVEDGLRVWNDHAARPTVAALSMRSRLREAEALCDPDGLGGFAVIEFDQSDPDIAPE
jgi:SAM-dependent MidA family methyltransferase